MSPTPTASPQLKVGYLVSRFPKVTETFILRELDEVAADPRVEVELFSLLPAGGGTVHPAAEPWVGRLHRPAPADGARALATWARTEPARLRAVVGTLVRTFKGVGLAKALTVLPLAAAHALEMRRLGVGHVHAHFAGHPGLAAWIVHALTGVPFSITAHAYDLFVDQRVLRLGLRHAAFFVTISEYNKRFLAAYGGDRLTPVAVVRCGIRPGDYRFRRRALDGDRVEVLCVGSLEPYKGQSVLLDAVAALGDGRVHLTLVGEGETRPALEAQVAELGLESQVELLGAQPEQRVAELLDRADVFVLPSVIAPDGKMEGLPVALMEALASGVPAIASDLSGVPELIRPGETGLLAQEGSPQALAAALRKVLDDYPAALDRAERGRSLVEAEYDVRRTAHRLVELFLAPPPLEPPATYHLDPASGRFTRAAP